VPCIDLRGEFSVWNFFIEAAILSAVPIKSGKMRDYDYLNTDNPEELSKFPEHDAMLDGHFELKAALGYKFYFKRWFVSPAAGFFYHWRKWSAMDGYKQHADKWTPDVTKEEIGGTIVTYQEVTYMMLVSLKGVFRINDMFEAGARVSYCPYINVSTIDSHIVGCQEGTERHHDNMQGFRLFRFRGNYI